MSTKPHYFAVGIFVLVSCALGLVGIIAISSDALKSPKYFIETYIDESVQGIDIGTPFTEIGRPPLQKSIYSNQ